MAVTTASLLVSGLNLALFAMGVYSARGSRAFGAGN